MTALRGSENAEEEKERRRSMIMRSCSLDLLLFRPSLSASSGSRNNFNLQSGNCSSTGEHITIFHKMRPSCVCDATELQAMAILWVARREMEEKLNFSATSNNDIEAIPYPFLQILQMQGSSTSGLSLKKSLRRFLQKRRDRIQSAIPYKQALF